MIILLQFWLQPVPYADLTGDNYVDLKDYTVLQLIGQGQLWVTRHKWYCNNVYKDGSKELVEGWTYSVWDNKPQKRDRHPEQPGFDWIDPQGKPPICRVNYIVFESMFPTLAVPDSDEPMYVESLTEPPQVTQWRIVAQHGTEPDNELWSVIEDGYVEPRTEGIYKLCVFFNRPMDTNNIDPGIVTICSQNDIIFQPSRIIWPDDRQMIIELDEPLPDKDNYTVTLGLDVTSAEGYVVAGDYDICITALKGDANHSREVNSQDLLAVNDRIGELIGRGNVRFDINCNYEINTQDLLAVYANIGNRAPHCSE